MKYPKGTMFKGKTMTSIPYIGTVIDIRGNGRTVLWEYSHPYVDDLIMTDDVEYFDRQLDSNCSSLELLSLPVSELPEELFKI